MTAEERDKEIEWLMGSIKRSAAGGHSMTFTNIFISVLFIAFGIFALFFFDRGEDYSVAPLLLLMGGVFLLSALISYVSHKRIAHAETPRGLLAAHDRMWVIQSVILMVGIIAFAVFNKGSYLSKACLLLSGLLLVIAGWLAMQQKLRLWVGIALLMAFSALLYFSRIGLLVGLPLLFLMLSIIKGEKSLFMGKESEGLDENDEQNFRRLRELVKESELRN
jgi:hypothetical protein